MRILAIQTYAGANETVVRHYPFYEKCGADKILGILTTDVGCEWPTDDWLSIGRDSYVSGSHLCQRLIDTIDACINFGADEIIVAEYDTLFFKPIPSPLPLGLVMNLTGGNSPGFKGNRYYHGPWCMTRHTALQVVSLGRGMIAEGDIEKGWPDRFIGWLAEKYNIPVVDGFFTSFTRNSLDTQAHVMAARQAVVGGVCALHGCKTWVQLQAITT